MAFTVQDDKVNISRLTKDDQDFFISVDGILYSRASIEISRDAPQEIQKIIADAYERGWITPIAWASEDQIMWDRLKKRT